MSYGFNADPVNYFGNEGNLILRPNKQLVREADGMSNQQKLQISLNNKIYHDEVDRTATIPQQNPVSTGLRLSYDDEERNSSVTSASGSMTAPSSVFWSLNDNIRTELDRQKEELEQYIKIQVLLASTIPITCLFQRLYWFRWCKCVIILDVLH